MANKYNASKFHAKTLITTGVFIENFQNSYQTIYTCSILINNLRFKFERLQDHVCLDRWSKNELLFLR